LRHRSGFLASVSNTFAAGIGSAANLILTILVAHQLGLATLGEYAVIGTVYGVLGVVDAARTQDLTTRYAAGGGNETLRLRLMISTAVVAVAFVGAAAFGSATDIQGAEGALVAWLGAAVQIMTAEAVASTQARHEFHRLAVATATGPVVGCSVAAVLLTELHLLALGIGLFLTSIVPRLILLADPETRRQFRRPADRDNHLHGQAISLSLLGGIAQLVNFTDVMAIRALSDAAEVGSYRAGSQIPTVLVGLIYRGFDISLPRLAGASESDSAALVRRMAPRLSLVIGAATALVIGLRVPLVRLVLGQHNHTAETVLWLFALVWLANSIVHPASLLLIARRRQQSILRLVGFEYVANLLLTLALVPSLGASGSALATLVTLAASNLVLMPPILARELPALPVGRHLVQDCLLPTAIAFGVVTGVIALVTA
jgi:O-antigen/teichoic acid export membrane protein